VVESTTQVVLYKPTSSIVVGHVPASTLISSAIGYTNSFVLIVGVLLLWQTTDEWEIFRYKLLDHESRKTISY